MPFRSGKRLAEMRPRQRWTGLLHHGASGCAEKAVGPRNSAGKLVFPGQPPGAEIAAKGNNALEARSGWDGSLVAGEVPLPRAVSCMKYMFLSPRPSPDWDYKDFNCDTDPAKMAVNAA